jgi:hypothetical protein
MRPIFVLADRIFFGICHYDLFLQGRFSMTTFFGSVVFVSPLHVSILNRESWIVREKLAEV